MSTAIQQITDERRELETQLAALKTKRRTLAEQTEAIRDDSSKKDERIGLLMERLSLKDEIADVKEQLEQYPEPRKGHRIKNFDDLNAYERFTMRGHNGLLAEESKQHATDLRNGNEAGQLASKYGGRVEGFKVSAYAKASGLDELTGSITSGFTMATDTTPGTGADRGVVPSSVSPVLVDRLKYFGPMADVVYQDVTATGESNKYGKLDDTTEHGEWLANQAGPATEQDLNAFTHLELFAYDMTSKLVKIQRRSKEDLRYNMPEVVRRNCFRRIGRGLNRSMTKRQTGHAAALASGIVDWAAGNELNSGAAAAIQASTLSMLPYEIDRAYRTRDEGGRFGFVNDGSMGMTGFMGSDNMEAALVALEDTQKRPLFLPSVRDGVPDMWNGKPIMINDAMDDVAANNFPMIYANFGHIVLRIVREMEFFRFFDSGTVLPNQEWFIAFGRFDYGVRGPTSAGDGRLSATRMDAAARYKIAS